MKAWAIGLAVIALLPGAAPIDRQPTTQPATQASLARVLAAIRAMERWPAPLQPVQPGSVDDLVHVRAALAGMASDLRARIARPRGTGVYHLPVAGRRVISFGQLSDAGIRSRGLTFAVRPGAPVVAPAAGIVRYAQVFRGYGGTVIVDHGRGWTSLLTGLGTLAVAPGSGVRGGMPLGAAGRGAAPRITLELRRRGRPVDAAAMIG